jgi:predicted PurR-regulated permease PerM
MKDGMDLPPAITIIAQALMALVFGFIGLLVAVPLTAATMVAVRMLYVQDVVGDKIPVLRTADAGSGG